MVYNDKKFNFNPDIKQVIAENIRKFRLEKGYTQEQLAEKCDLSPRYISDIENHNGNIPIDTLENIAKVLKVEPYLLIKPQKHQDLPKRVNMK